MERQRVERFTVQRDLVSQRATTVEEYFAGLLKEIKWINDYFTRVYSLLFSGLSKLR